MSISDFHIIITTKVIRFLSWKRIFLFFLVISGLCGCILFFQFSSFSLQKRIPTAGDKVKLLIVNNNVKTKITNLVTTRSDLIAGVRILTLNFQRNIRIATFAEIENKDLLNIYNTHLNNRVYDVPIFSDSIADNNLILHIINGEFICIPFKGSLGYKRAPDASPYINSMCIIGIPPYNNDVSGLMTIYFSREPTPEERATIFLFMRDISMNIYNSSYGQN